MTDVQSDKTRRAALLVVDVQVGVMAASIDSERVIATIACLVAKARDAGVPVIWVRHQSPELVPGTDAWQIVPQLVPAPGEPIVEKKYGDSFAETDLAEQLKRVGADSIVLCGAQSDACIRSTFYGSIYRGYGTTLVSDAHTTEDMREWGMTFSPEQSIEMLNTHAEFTSLPGVTIEVKKAEEALSSAAPPD